MCFVVLFLTLPLISMSQSASYVIGNGDQLFITVVGYSEFTTTTTVKDNGMITMAILGEMQAAGKTKEEFTNDLRKRLAEYIQGDINLTVSILSSVGQRITVLGAVARPSNYAVVTEINLLELISMAGGTSSDANLSKVKIFHKDRKQGASEVDLDYYIERSDIENIPKVQPGEIVFVPRRDNFIKEFGEFFRDVAFFFALFRLSEASR